MKNIADRIDFKQLRRAVAESQKRHRCTEECGDYIMRIHDIVIKTSSYFRQTTHEEEEEAKSYSIERWISRGIYNIDLKKHVNPFSYMYSGAFLNMLSRIQCMRRKQIKREQYERKMLNELKMAMPSLQNKDLTGINEF